MTPKEEITLYVAERSLRQRESQFINLCVLNSLFVLVFGAFIYLVNLPNNVKTANPMPPTQSVARIAFEDLNQLAKPPIAQPVEQITNAPKAVPDQDTVPMPQVTATQFYTTRWHKNKAIRSRWSLKKRTASAKHIAHSRQQSAVESYLNADYLRDSASQSKNRWVWNKAKGDFELEK